MIPKCIVLDTNVCLDLFVFNDPRWQLLLDALQSGLVDAVTRADCRREWQIVLGYAHLGLNEMAQQRCREQFDAVIACMPMPTADSVEAPKLLSSVTSTESPENLLAVKTPRMPICRDPDDQKFLELARDADASVLITKDKALLKLAGKTRRAGLFQIMQPQDWQKMMFADATQAVR